MSAPNPDVPAPVESDPDALMSLSAAAFLLDCSVRTIYRTPWLRARFVDHAGTKLRRGDVTLYIALRMRRAA